MRLVIAALASILLFPAGPAAAQPAGTTDVVVHAGRLLDRPGQAPRGASTLLIRDGHVAEVRDGHVDPASLGVPEARVLDLRSRFVLPGLIDSHVHLDSDAGGIAAQMEEVTLSPPAKAFDALVNARKTLDAGFTRRDPGWQGGRPRHTRCRKLHLDHVGPHGRPPRLP